MTTAEPPTTSQAWFADIVGNAEAAIRATAAPTRRPREDR